uniref:Uncharacterized protein n=1 Tax=Megaselia scalaris TaxID=36166 RepID=T1GEB3_MEGSC
MLSALFALINAVLCLTNLPPTNFSQSDRSWKNARKTDSSFTTSSSIFGRPGMGIVDIPESMMKRRQTYIDVVKYHSIVTLFNNNLQLAPFPSVTGKEHICGEGPMELGKQLILIGLFKDLSKNEKLIG